MGHPEEGSTGEILHEHVGVLSKRGSARVSLVNCARDVASCIIYKLW
jgi:hypothetical protein